MEGRLRSNLDGGKILPWLTMKICLMGLRTKEIEIMMVQTLMLVPVIQNIKKVMRICFDGDFANSQAF